MNESNQPLADGRDLEPEIAHTLNRIHAARASGPYALCKEDELRSRLEPFLLREGVRNPRVEDLSRLAGGASKEQFVFTLMADGQSPRSCVLRLEPVEGVAITSRRRELEAIRAVSDVVPVPEVLWIDPDGDALGRPALITGFVEGVTKPSDTSSNITGFGTVLGESLRGIPVLGLAERWMRDNLPETSELVLIHGDYRTGNYLFDEETGTITAILDWEFTHVGDYHEDLAWISLRPWSNTENGTLLASGLFPYDELATRYTAVSGREVNLKTLHFYQVLCLYKCTVICLGSGLRAAHEAHNHQDALMSWLTPAGYVFMNELIDLIEQGAPL